MAYACPESKRLQVKVLWLTVYDSGGRLEKEELEDAPEGNRPSGQTLPEQATTKPKEPLPEQAEAKRQISSGQTVEADGDREVTPKETAETQMKDPLESQTKESSDSGKQSQDTEEQTRADQDQPLPEKLSDLKEKLQIYLDIVQDRDNQGLVKHGLTRLGKIIKSIRPRFMRAEALVGVGEPDLTGYVYGVYWAVKPFLGKKCQVAVTPDFDRRILEGEAELGGRIMAVALVRHVVRILLDRRLRQLMGQLKNISK